MSNPRAFQFSHYAMPGIEKLVATAPPRYDPAFVLYFLHPLEIFLLEFSERFTYILAWQEVQISQKERDGRFQSCQNLLDGTLSARKLQN
jgi:hypothetical protein